MRVAVVILNYNGRKHLEHYLPSVVKFSKGHQVVVADNASTDDSLPYLKKVYPEVSLIEMSKNTGFAGGYNEALKQVEADIYVLLNSDVEVTEGWIAPIIKRFSDDEKLVACQPKILADKNREYFEHAGAAGGELDKLFYPFCRGRVFDKVEKDEGQYNDFQHCFWASGAAMFIRAEGFHKYGGFDADFFAHMEEIDLCWRLQNSGFHVGVEPQSVVYHLGGGTLAYMNPKKTYLNHRNSLYMIVKNYPGNYLGQVFLRLILDGLAAIKYLLSGKAKHVSAVFNAHMSLYKNLSKLARKRSIQKQGLPSTIFDTSVVFEGLFRGKKTFPEIVADTKRLAQKETLNS